MDPKGGEDFNFLQFGADPKRNGRMQGLKKNRKGMEEVFAPVPFSMTSLGTGPGVITPGGEKQMGVDNNGYHHHMNMNPHNHYNNHNNHYRPSGGIRNFNNGQNHMQPHGNGPLIHHQKNSKINHAPLHYEYPNQQLHHPQNRGNHVTPVNANNGYEKAPVAPRFMKQTSMYPPPTTGPHQQNNQVNEELSLRPPPSSIMKRMPPAPFKGPTFGPTMNEPNRLNQRSPPQPIPPPQMESSSSDYNKNSLEKNKKDKVRLIITKNNN